MKNIALCLSALILFQSCYTSKFTTVQLAPELDSKISYSEQKLVMEQGAPSKVDSDGNGGKILTYSAKSYTTNTNTTSYANYYVPYSVNSDYTSKTYENITFTSWYISKDDKVYYWRTNRPKETTYEDRQISTGLTLATVAASTGVLLLIVTKAGSDDKQK